GIACASASTRPPSLIARETSSAGATGDSIGFGTTAGASSGRFQSSSVSAMDGVRLSSTCGGSAESGPVCSVASTPGAGSDAGACSATSSGGRFQSSCCPVANGSSPSTGGRLQSSISGGGEDSSPSIGVTLHGSSSAMFQSSLGDVTSKPGSAQGSAGSCSLTTGLPSSSSGNGSMSSGGALSAGAGSDFFAAAVSPRPLRAVRFFFFPLRFSGSGYTMMRSPVAGSSVFVTPLRPFLCSDFGLEVSSLAPLPLPASGTTSGNVASIGCAAAPARLSSDATASSFVSVTTSEASARVAASLSLSVASRVASSPATVSARTASGVASASAWMDDTSSTTRKASMSAASAWTSVPSTLSPTASPACWVTSSARTAAPTPPGEVDSLAFMTTSSAGASSLGADSSSRCAGPKPNR